MRADLIGQQVSTYFRSSDSNQRFIIIVVVLICYCFHSNNSFTGTCTAHGSHNPRLTMMDGGEKVLYTRNSNNVDTSHFCTYSRCLFERALCRIYLTLSRCVLECTAASTSKTPIPLASSSFSLFLLFHRHFWSLLLNSCRHL